MAYDFQPNPRPTTLEQLWDRLCRLVTSMNASVFITGIELKAGAPGTLVPHGQSTPPKFYSVHQAGAAAGTAVITKGPIGARFLTVYTTADCTADIELKL